MRTPRDFLKKLQALFTHAAQNNLMVVIYVDYGEGPFPLRAAKSTREGISLQYTNYDYLRDVEEVSSTMLLASDIANVRCRNNVLSGIDYDEEEFRIELMQLPEPPQFSDNISNLGSWISKDVLLTIRDRIGSGAAISDEAYLWLIRCAVLWSTEVDWYAEAQSSLMFPIAEFLNSLEFMVDRSGEFDAAGFVDNFKCLSDCPEEAWETLADMTNSRFYDPSPGPPSWAQTLYDAISNNNQGENSERLHQALHVVAQPLVNIASDLHKRCHPDTGYKMWTKIAA